MVKFKAIKYTIGTTIGQGLTVPLLGLFLTAALFIGCKGSITAPDNSPPFSDMAPLGGKLYVAYKSPDAAQKLDTIKISFTYNSSKVKSIDVRATLDSERTWIRLGAAMPAGSGKAAYKWIPKNDSIAFNYCGKREAVIRVIDSLTNEHIDSDSFLIVGAVPYVLVSPKRKETFGVTDTVQIVYTQNQDLSSSISVGFLLPTDTGYVNISDKNMTVVLSKSLPIKNFVTKFVPIDFAGRAGNFTNPITIFIADYGGPSAVLRADSITIIQ